MSEVIDRGLDHSGFLPKNKQPLVIFIILTYTLLMSYFGRFSGYDEPFFKGAGREWGTTGRFAATELADSDWYPTTSFKVDVKPEEVFFFYPPLYSLGFGLIVKLFGFGWRQCVFYDAFIRAVLAYAFVQIAHQMSVGKRRDWLITLLSFAILLQGFSERPDDLATCLAMIGLLPLIGLSTNRSQIILSGISFGLCAGTSVGAAGMLAMIAITLLLSNSTPWQVRIRDFAIWCSVSAAVFLMVVFPLLYLHPGAINQYRANAATAIKSYPELFSAPLQFIGVHIPFVSSMSGILAVNLLLVPAALRSNNRKYWLRLYCGTLAALLFWFMSVPNKILYLWFVAPWLIALYFSVLSTEWNKVNKILRTFSLALLAFSLLLGSINTIKPIVYISFLPKSQRQDENQRLLNSLIPAKSKVLCTDAWWFIADNREVYDARWTHPDMEKIDFVILSGNGSGKPGFPILANEWLEDFPLYDHVHVVNDNLNREVPQFFGVPLSRSSYGFGSLVLERNSRSNLPLNIRDTSQDP